MKCIWNIELTLSNIIAEVLLFMKILVTGALGHIGSSLIRYLPYKFPKSEIVIVDNMLTQRFTSLFNLPAVGRYRFIEMDITTATLDPIVKECDVVIHLSAITDAASSFGNATAVEFNNLESTKHVAAACAKAGVRLIALSSTSVYGTQSDLVSEDCSDDDLRPQSPYAETKLKEERYISDLVEAKELNAVLCRFGTIFGVSPGMRFHTAVNKFCWQAVMGQPITVWESAYDQKRPYLDLNDAVRAISHIIRNDIFDGNTYNILTLNATVRDVVQTISEFVPGIEIAFVESEIMNQLSYEVSCERFKDLGFVFSGNLYQAIGETLSLLSQSNTLSK
jgi:UDP-glucose 4-epimerase